MGHEINVLADGLLPFFVSHIYRLIQVLLHRFCKGTAITHSVIKHLRSVDGRVSRQRILMDADKAGIFDAVDKRHAILCIAHLLLSNAGRRVISEGIFIPAGQYGRLT